VRAAPVPGAGGGGGDAVGAADRVRVGVYVAQAEFPLRGGLGEGEEGAGVAGDAVEVEADAHLGDILVYFDRVMVGWWCCVVV